MESDLWKHSIQLIWYICNRNSIKEGVEGGEGGEDVTSLTCNLGLYVWMKKVL
ncbi:hypothetical protein BGZ61DRAFT_464612 [Ilyonectria robusta]|uniref:uncharacterized protein n=1 Tax=Ilyonectria robusta TaxID=1079257 RepID=UPI001E8DCEBF|nr:uncharacterized protein BGZ61DRAFT_464612 [Ilyonectria robusta]KAH8661056.1 hypothetical protein BGZ61DRAFT_464612 [Ilyonectria robusta]